MESKDDYIVQIYILGEKNNGKSLHMCLLWEKI